MARRKVECTCASQPFGMTIRRPNSTIMRKVTQEKTISHWSELGHYLNLNRVCVDTLRWRWWFHNISRRQSTRVPMKEWEKPNQIKYYDGLREDDATEPKMTAQNSFRLFQSMIRFGRPNAFGPFGHQLIDDLWIGPRNWYLNLSRFDSIFWLSGRCRIQNADDHVQEQLQALIRPGACPKCRFDFYDLSPEWRKRLCIATVRSLVEFYWSRKMFIARSFFFRMKLNRLVCKMKLRSEYRTTATP